MNKLKTFWQSVESFLAMWYNVFRQYVNFQEEV